MLIVGAILLVGFLLEVGTQHLKNDPTEIRKACIKQAHIEKESCLNGECSRLQRGSPLVTRSIVETSKPMTIS